MKLCKISIRIPTLLVLATTIAVANGFQTQKWKPLHPNVKPELLVPLMGEVSINKIVESCDAFLKATGLRTSSTDIPGVSRSCFDGKRQDYYSVDYGSEYSFTVLAVNGKVLTFLYLARQAERAEGKKRESPYLLTDAINAKGYVKRLLEKLGKGDEYQIASFYFNMAYEGGLVQIGVEASAHGYPLGIYDSANMSVDPYDGAIIGYGRRYTPYKIESFAAKLTLEQAKKAAELTVKKYGVGTYRQGMIESIRGAKTGDQLLPTKNLSRLQYVTPNGRLGGTKYDVMERPTRLRLAWFIWYPGDECIWIDAADGRVLGGISKIAN